MVAFANLAGYTSYGDDGYGVVGCTYIDDAHQRGYRQLGSALSADASSQDSDNIVYAAVMLDDFQ